MKQIGVVTTCFVALSESSNVSIELENALASEKDHVGQVKEWMFELKRVRVVLWSTAALALTAYSWLSLTGGALRPVSPPITETFQPKFALADPAGKIRTETEFRGRHLLVFFGFTNCPDICPTTLSEVAQIMDVLGDLAGKVQPLFISIDPARDRALGLAEFAAAFHPSILALAGDDASTQAAADSFKIFFERDADASAPDGYTMSHSPALYLIDATGNWVRSYSYGTPAPEVVADLKPRLSQ